jgi:membrane protein implicated in regulation of membrane protease activity
MLKGKNRYETLENLSIFFICIGTIMLSLGIGLAVLTPKVAVLAMFGVLVSFLAIVALIFIWLAKEFFGKEKIAEKTESETKEEEVE